MNRSLCLACILLVVFVSACSTRNTTPEYESSGFVLESETLDPELSEPWPGIEHDTQLTEAERTALQSVQGVHCELDDFARGRIREQFIHLRHGLPGTVDRWLERSERYLPYARRVFRERGLPEELAYLPFIESGFNPRAYSHAGAGGLWQFMPFTGRKYGLRVDNWMDERRDPYKATHAAADYLEFLYSMFHDWTLALAAYNCGEGKMMRAVETLGADNFFEVAERNHELQGRARLRPETLDYVPRFMAMMKIAENLELLGYGSLDMEAPTDVQAVQVAPGTNLRGLAQACNMSYETFRQDNLAFAQESSPLNYRATVYVSHSLVASTEEYLDSPQATASTTTGTHTVQRGEYLAMIASNYGLTVAELKRINNLGSNTIYPGQRLKVTTSGTMTASAENPARNDTPVRNAQEVAASTNTPNAAESAPRPIPVESVSRATTASNYSGSYRVSPGDTLFSLSRRYGVSVNDLLHANGLSSPQDLRAGQNLRVPGGSNQSVQTASAEASSAPIAGAVEIAANDQPEPRTYQVQSGDTVYSISRQFSVSPHDVMRWNSLDNNSVIHPGDSITLHTN
ncbi:MAG: LysM peptidoglycan-binding domain-containing protein [Desulfovibrio sp.]|nr:MAG: LysM peptidoglycan-binding domain-containing protein [Desulfovibrio sp.]